MSTNSSSKREREGSGDNTEKPDSKSIKMGDKADKSSKTGKTGTMSLEDLIKTVKEIRSDMNNFRKSIEQKIDKMKKDMMDKIEHEIKSVREDLNTEVNKVMSRLGEIDQRLDEYENKQKGQSKEIADLKFRLIDQEARSRRNNLLFFGISENKDENPTEEVKKVISNQLGIARDMAIQRAHRIGKPSNQRKRPIIAMFRDYPDVDDVMANGRELAETPYSVSRDYPAEIRAARAKLYPLMKKNRAENNKAWIAYPAKLVVNGQVYHDAFKGPGGTNQPTLGN